MSALRLSIVILCGCLLLGFGMQDLSAAPKKGKAKTAAKSTGKTGAAKSSKYNTISNVVISGNNNRITIAVVVTGQPRYKIMQLEEPYRLVLHIFGGATSLKDATFSDMEPLRGVRYAIYSDKPERIQSLVFDLKNAVVVNVQQNPRYLVLTLTGGGITAIPDWKAVAGTVDTAATGAPVAGSEGGAAPPLPPDSIRPGNQAPGLVSTELQRKYVDYSDGKRRDPFEPITQNFNVEFGQMALPRVDELKLVGVSGVPGSYIALMEDGQGFGYALHAGSPIRDGKVEKITPTNVTFLVSEADWSKQVTIDLPKKMTP